jgi:5'-3' exonuclease
MSIDHVRDFLLRDLDNKFRGIRTFTRIEQNKVLADYILICFFGGNDFLPHLPSVVISTGTLDTVMELYFTFLKNNDDFLTNDFKINLPVFTRFMTVLHQHENKMVSDNITERSRRNSGMVDPIDYRHVGWEARHYTHYFKFENLMKSVGSTPNHNDLDIYSITKNYIKGLEWILGYYAGKCVDRKWYYSEHATPSISAILYQLRRGYTNCVFEERPFVTEHQQLMCVLPPSSSGLVPVKYRKLMLDPESELCMYYPEQISFDMTFCSEDWQAKSVFLPVDFQEIVAAMELI